ncbi:MAG: hypothetical protein C0462_02075 [Alcanivorax sp.]|nr:hypothetical protein [Alcanivorax sp.]
MNVVHVLKKRMPPDGSNGGLPVLVDELAEAQVKLGHDVVVLTTELVPSFRQHCGYKLQMFSGCDCPQDVLLWGDIFHLHGDFGSFCEILRLNKKPFVRTIHGVGGKSGPHDIYVSRSHAEAHGSQRYVYNGVNIEKYSISEGKGDFALFLGQVSRSKKGVGDAIRAARIAGTEIVVAGGRNNRWPSTWFSWPFSGVSPVGVVRGDMKVSLLSRARCVLFPSKWPEPFGLVLVEAMASGTPVLAYDCGAAREIILDGYTGFICRDYRDMSARINDCDELSPEKCRWHVEQNFTSFRMAEDYNNFYLKSVNEAFS